MIERFSEDVDLILDWTRFLDLGDPNAERSKTKQGVFNEKMNEVAGQYVSGELRDRLIWTGGITSPIAVLEQITRSVRPDGTRRIGP